MPLNDASDMLALSTALGNSDNLLQQQIAGENPTNAIGYLQDARNSIDSLHGEFDYDSAQTWQASLRTVEVSMASSLATMLRAACVGANTYFTTSWGATFKAYWDAREPETTVSWTSNFRALWRRTMLEELVVKLGSITRGSGWGSYVSSTTISVASTLNVRAATEIGAADITLTLTLTDENDETDVQVLTIPAESSAGTVFAVGSGTKYKAVVGASATGGTTADSLDVWVRP